MNRAHTDLEKKAKRTFMHDGVVCLNGEKQTNE